MWLRKHVGSTPVWRGFFHFLSLRSPNSRNWHFFPWYWLEVVLIHIFRLLFWALIVFPFDFLPSHWSCIFVTRKFRNLFLEIRELIFYAEENIFLFGSTIVGRRHIVTLVFRFTMVYVPYWSTSVSRKHLSLFSHYLLPLHLHVLINITIN